MLMEPLLKYLGWLAFSTALTIKCRFNHVGTPMRLGEESMVWVTDGLFSYSRSPNYVVMIVPLLGIGVQLDLILEIAVAPVLLPSSAPLRT